MASLGAEVQSTNNELVTIIEELKDRRTELDRNIKKEEEERLRLIAELQALQERLTLVEESLQKKYTTRNEFDRTIAETSSQFTKILDSSRLLLSSVRQQSLMLVKK